LRLSRKATIQFSFTLLKLCFPRFGRLGSAATPLGFRLLTYSRAVARQSGENGMRVVFGIVGCLLLIACGFEALTVLLPMTGIYGVISYIVERQTQEFGIRIALGAQPHDILQQVAGPGLRLLMPGVTIGFVGIFAGSYVLRAILVKVSPVDPLSLIGATVLFVSLALFACIVPTRKALKVQPVEALGYE
jgi:hypothetical protein